MDKTTPPSFSHQTPQLLMKINESYKINKIGFVIKHHQPEAGVLANQLAEFALNKGLKIFFANESKILAKEISYFYSQWRKNIKIIPKVGLVNECDLIIVLGGDGTFLSIAQLMKKRSIPILGINLGQLGFLTEIKKEEALRTLNEVLNGMPLAISERALLEVTLKRQNKIIFQGLAANDAVISKGAIARIIGIQTWVNDMLVSQIRADGMIVSTPTGSTAYALAAGGPIIEPTVPALVLAPICPHSLTLRPLVISDTYEVKFCLNHRPGHVLLTLDGQDAIDMKKDDIVLIKRYKKHSLKLVSSPTRDYFGLLREKLKFGVRD